MLTPILNRSLWRGAPITPIGVQLAVTDDTTGHPLTHTDLTALTGQLAILPAGTSPDDTTTWTDFTWVLWPDDLGEPVDTARILVAAADWPDTDIVNVWWRLTDGANTYAGQVLGSIELHD